LLTLAARLGRPLLVAVVHFRVLNVGSGRNLILIIVGRECQFHSKADAAWRAIGFALNSQRRCLASDRSCSQRTIPFDSKETISNRGSQPQSRRSYDVSL